MNLLHLNLDNNGLLDQDVTLLCETIRVEAKQLRKLNIAKNDVGNRACKELRRLFEEHKHLDTLGLAWASIHG
eukprot:CAMPEP_0118872298 /NCGR_PEP_ID=MMETSP1163-20130328/14539_1 /TAXON_ID=124430 /ORGANISM="Phaeomonas parva, Strain CCMP2877" /LENGTH=72 /DNA_ID=CAMNT_0006807469 /DNA_START=24 /DNA_END=239 /DNA_ORIENTATION=-